MAPTSTAGVNRKKPPTFQHLPEQRAKKLKRDWVEKQKIKSKWKAEKRREGIVTQRDVQTLASKVDEHQDDVDNEQGSSSDEDSSEDVVAGVNTEPRLPAPSRAKPKPAGEDEAAKPSLRDLQREAYSRESLHHHKSDPMHRRRGRGRNTESGIRGGRGRGGNFGSRSGTNGGGLGRGGGRGGGGQPDMRLRMAAMLEKVKQSVANDR
ncbi:hypothetical protein OF83DRAFT_1072429 [Amylostereum chailletii]|nr:hypothetical protein OF83DRAFT_1072429 [Amylostereum chailletii]